MGAFRIAIVGFVVVVGLLLAAWQFTASRSGATIAPAQPGYRVSSVVL